MNRMIKAISVIALALIIGVSSLVISSAEVTVTEEETVNVTSAAIDEGDDGSKAYELVWKYKYNDSHVWKRRWNMTLGCWYDPDWILVY